ncbi:MAG TPA: hypothetical protein VLM76_09550 [Patescibacteria group bacterium]|nr:hypothetical protein [Patescibacteria group bacterium]
MTDVPAKDRNSVMTEMRGTRLPNGSTDFDTVTARHVSDLIATTGRPLLIYASAWDRPHKRAIPVEMSMSLGDKEGWKQIIDSLPAGPVDVLLHSPGGELGAAQSAVRMLRAKFTDVRFIVPLGAKSAATMLALSGNRIAMDSASELGPIDPQFVFRRGDGSTTVSPAIAIKRQFERAADELAHDPKRLTAWMPMLNMYAPSLLVEADQQLSLSKQVVIEWMRDYMFGSRADAEAAATAIADALTDYDTLKAHSSPVDVDQALALGLPVTDLRDPAHAALRSDIWGVAHCVSVILSESNTYKLFESSAGVIFAEQAVFEAVGPLTPAGSGSPPAPGKNLAIRPRKRR